METENGIEQFGQSEIRHAESCRCKFCLARAMGQWIDGLAEKTRPGRWQLFGTATFRTPDYPWQKGFPMSGSYKPSPHFAHRTYEQLIRYLETELRSPLDYVVADQLGAVNGRLHQHFILAGLGLDGFPRAKIWNRLFERAGFNRILPFERGAAYYVGRYIGRAVADCEWDVHLTSSAPTPRMRMPNPRGGLEIVHSADLAKHHFKNTKKEWHR